MASFPSGPARYAKGPWRVGLIVLIGWLQGCSLHVHFDKVSHYAEQRPSEEATSTLIERMIDNVESTEEQ